MNAFAKGFGKAALLALLLTGSGAFASRLAGPIVTGTVSAVSGTSAVTIDGRTYSVQPNSPAGTELTHIKAGQVVDAMLSGPPSSADSEVIDITPHVGA